MADGMDLLVLKKWEIVLAARSLPELALVEVDDVGADVVKEALVVGHNEQSLLVPLQVVVQPDDGVKVKVVGRFVKHQQSRFNEKGAGQ